MEPSEYEQLGKIAFDHYMKRPELCSYCGAPLEFECFANQLELEHKFCDTLCKKKFESEVGKTSNKINGFESATERVIYNFLKREFPYLKVRHNVKNIIPPYEIDFIIDDYCVAIEFNGIFHSQQVYSDRRFKKTKLNDSKKKKLLTKNGYHVCRLWSSIGLYNRQDLFFKVLHIVKDNVKKCLMTFSLNKCLVIDIIVVSEDEIEVQYSNKNKFIKKDVIKLK